MSKVKAQLQASHASSGTLASVGALASGCAPRSGQTFIGAARSGLVGARWPTVGSMVRSWFASGHVLAADADLGGRSFESMVRSGLTPRRRALVSLKHQ